MRPFAISLFKMNIIQMCVEEVFTTTHTVKIAMIQRNAQICDHFKLNDQRLDLKSKLKPQWV